MDTTDQNRREEELRDFEGALQTFFRSHREESGSLDPDLEARILRTIAEHETPSRSPTVFFVIVMALVSGAVGAAIWTPLIFLGAIVLSGAYAWADRAIRRRRASISPLLLDDGSPTAEGP